MTSINGIRVLVVNDDEASRYALARPLQAKGYRVFEAGTVGEGIQLLKEQVFHVAILDVKLPDGNGTEEGPTMPHY